jgi:hypothetical protein
VKFGLQATDDYGWKTDAYILSAYIRVHPRLVLIRQHKSISAKFQETETAWSLLKGWAIAFVPTKLGRG